MLAFGLPHILKNNQLLECKFSSCVQRDLKLPFPKGRWEEVFGVMVLREGSWFSGILDRS